MWRGLLKRLFALIVALCVLDAARSFCCTIPHDRTVSLVSTPCRQRNQPLHSSIGDGGDRPPSDNDRRDRQSWEDFLNRDGDESENMRRAREYMSDYSLPISYDSNNGNDVRNTEQNELSKVESTSSALVANSNSKNVDPFESGGLAPETLQRNPYLAVVMKLSPSEIISKFTTAAPPGVQNAVRSTILGLIGGLPKLAFETTTVTTGQKLASLMFQLQMTGYMFKVIMDAVVLLEWWAQVNVIYPLMPCSFGFFCFRTPSIDFRYGRA
jgi:Protein of unknown function (DUF760)